MCRVVVVVVVVEERYLNLHAAGSAHDTQHVSDTICRPARSNSTWHAVYVNRRPLGQGRLTRCCYNPAPLRVLPSSPSRPRAGGAQSSACLRHGARETATHRAPSVLKGQPARRQRGADKLT